MGSEHVEFLDGGAEALQRLDGTVGMRLADRVYEILRRAISEGHLGSKAHVIEQSVATQLGVSRTPVREALRRLQADGVLQSLPHRGFVVVDLTEDAAAVYAIRQRLEGLAGALAAQRITVAQYHRLSALQDEMEALILSDAPDAVVRLAELNTDFHRGMNAAAGSPRLQHLIEQLIPAYVSRQVVALYSPEERAASFMGHRQILDALWQRDQTRVDWLIQEHLRLGERIVLAKIAENAGAPVGSHEAPTPEISAASGSDQP